MGTRTLNVLGCVPKLLNLLFELAESSHSIRSFNVIKNIPVDVGNEFNPMAGWDIRSFEPGKFPEELGSRPMFALSVVGTRSKEIVLNEFRRSLEITDEQFIKLIDPTSHVAASASIGFS